MRELALIALLGIGFGLGTYRGNGEMGPFGAVNLAVGFAALVASAGLFARHWRRERFTRSGGGPLRDAALAILAIAWGALLVNSAAAHFAIRFDWTFENRYELAPATQEAVARLSGPLRVTLYHDAFDPRTRRTRLLLDQLSHLGGVEVHQRLLGEAPEEEDVFGISSSNAVVLEAGGRFERADRPTEGALFEAISYLGERAERTLYASAGAGEGDLESTGPRGFSGLAAALETEGFQILRLSSPNLKEIPADADALLLLAPQRHLHPALLDAVRRYLERGGTVITMLEPGRQTGLEDLLADYGMQSPNAVIVDPTSRGMDASGSAVNPIVSRYSDHPVTAGLKRNRQTYFRGARSFQLRKPRPEDILRPVAFASGESWLDPDLRALTRRGSRERPPGTRSDYHPLTVVGRYARNGREARIVAFGDSDFARNSDLRALYNLDLFMNAVHWGTRREARITLRPKVGSLIQFPVPIQNSLRAFYGVGLFVPEVLLAAGGLVWLRRRAS